ncbi:MAG: hypothetical protein OHK0046_16150 [Anaerolineae bacterium]
MTRQLQSTAPPWGMAAALGAIFAMLISLIIGTVLADVLLGSTPEAFMTGWAIGMVLTIFFVLFTRQNDQAALRLGATRARLPLVLLGMIGVAAALDLLSAIVTGNQTLAAAELLNFSRSEVNFFGWLVAFLFLVILQPIGEELVFRGMAYPALRAAAGRGLALVLCAGFHAMFHFIAYPPSPENRTILLWYGLVLPFLDALIFTQVRASTGSTRAAIVAHAAFGLFALLKVFTFSG